MLLFLKINIYIYLNIYIYFLFIFVSNCIILSNFSSFDNFEQRIINCITLLHVILGISVSPDFFLHSLLNLPRSYLFIMQRLVYRLHFAFISVMCSNGACPRTINRSFSFPLVLFSSLLLSHARLSIGDTKSVCGADYDLSLALR